MIENVEQVIREYIKPVIHMSLATVSAKGPWVCEVHFAYDDDLNLYFRSQISTRHSGEIAADPRVAGTIHQKHTATEPPRGVYFEGTAEMLTNSEQRQAVIKPFERIKVSEGDIKKAENPGSFQVYKVTVSDYYLFDARDSKPSQKYHLPWRKSDK